MVDVVVVVSVVVIVLVGDVDGILQSGNSSVRNPFTISLSF